MREDLEMTDPMMKSAQQASKGKTVLVAAVIVGVCVAIGLGVGLGVGLKNVEYVYVTVLPTEPTKAETPAGQTAMTTTPAGDGPWMNYRLPENLVPSHYRLTVQPNLTLETYTGSNEMTFNVKEATKYVIIHAHKDLIIDEDSVKLQRKNDMSNVQIMRKFRYLENQFYIIEAENDLEMGQDYLLSIDFSNSLVSAIVGIYMSSYNDPISGERKGIVATDMEPTDSRRGYPCFDEPALKVQYTIVIIHEQRHTALGNMPVNMTEEIGNGWNRTEFEISVPMSTYLACFCVGELDYVEGFSGRGVPLRIYGAKYQIEGSQGDYALKVTKAMFDEYEKLFDMDYSLPKYDQIALPEFLSGAMENWGLVTYRETYLMWDPVRSSTTAKQSVAAVIAHEMVHQWFGNIVTMKWWDNIWLNEGFASYFEYDGLSWAEPTWNTDGFNALFDVQSALRADQTITSHPIVVNVSTPSQIAEVFDTITYQKGSSILRYMKYVLGDDLFIGGLRNYLQHTHFSNANEQDLWMYVQEYVTDQGSDFNVVEMMDAWVQQQGYPVVHVDVAGTQVTLSQGIMLIDPNADKSSLPASKYSYLWKIKIEYLTSSGVTSSVWLDASMTDVTFNINANDKWVKLNAGQNGFYRVNYDDATWSSIAMQLQDDHTVFEEVDRSQLMTDALNLAPAEHMTYVQALDMTRYLDGEESYFVWSAFSSGSSYIRSMLASTDHFENFKKYFLSRVKPIADKLGWDATMGSHEDKRLRRIALSLALAFGDEDAMNNVTYLFEQWRNHGADIHPDVRYLVYQYGIAGANEEDWDYVLDRYMRETVAEEKNNLLRGLASTTNVALIDRLLNYTKDNTIIKEQDFFNCITYISYTEDGNRMAWSWTRANWEYMVDRFRIENMYLGRLVPNIVSGYNTEVQKWEVDDFFKKYPEGGAGTNRRKAAQLQIDLNIAWLAKNQEPIGTWLAERVAEMPVTSTPAPMETTAEPEMMTTPGAGDGPWLNYRLPENLVPSHYRLTVQPNLTLETYTGSNEMTFNVKEATRYVIIHAHKDLVIDEDSVKLQRKNDMSNVQIMRKFRYLENQFYIIEAENNLEMGQDYLLSMDFSNSLVSAIVGIYMSSYNDPISGERKGIVATDMEPTDSRRGYPCFDEPALKIQYTIVIIHEQRHTALGNMPVNVTEDLGNGWNRTEFEISVPMSTYLACFCVGELDYVEGFSGRGIPLRIYGAKYQIEGGQGDYALKATKAMFDEYEALFGMNYSLPKYDQIALPEFLSGAMENWGLVTYREAYLMWDPVRSSTTAKQSVAAVIAHEMVHQWFGNIVTMKWWDNIWLNEGFASYFEYDGLSWAEPTWNTDGFNALFDVQSALRADQSITSHPIVVNVSTPSQIAEVFDTITYQKGSSILRYMKYVLGEDLFIGGLRNYLQNTHFSNANEQDLWTYVQEYISQQGYDFNVVEIMDAWIQQQGYPVVHVDVSGTQVTLSQEIMLNDPNADKSSLPASNYNYLWNIKIEYLTSSNIRSSVWLNASSPEVTFNIGAGDTWVKLNAGQNGFYRVNYDDATWSSIAMQLQDDHTVFKEVDRSQLMNDVFNLAPAEHMTYVQALDMTRYLDGEESYFVWSAFSSGSSYIRSMLASTDHFENFKIYYQSRVKPIADKLGWNATEGSHEEKRLRRIALSLALAFGDEDTMNNVTYLFEEWRNHQIDVHPDVRYLVYQYGIAGASEEDWDYVLDRYMKETVAEEKNNLLRGLASTNNVDLIDRLLNYTKDKTIIKEQDFFNCITYISYTEVGNRMAWSWTRANWEYMVDRFRIENMYLGRLVPNIVSGYNTKVQKWEVDDFFKKYPEGGAGTSRRKTAQLQIDLNIAWLAKNQDSIGEWLTARVAEM